MRVLSAPVSSRALQTYFWKVTFTVLVFLASETTFSQPFGFVESNRPVRDALDHSSFLVFVQNVFFSTFVLCVSNVFAKITDRSPILCPLISFLRGLRRTRKPRMPNRTTCPLGPYPRNWCHVTGCDLIHRRTSPNSHDILELGAQGSKIVFNFIKPFLNWNRYSINCRDVHGFFMAPPQFKGLSVRLFL